MAELTVTPSKDSGIDKDSPTFASGGSIFNYVRDRGGDGNFIGRALYSFDISELEVGATIVSANLTLSAYFRDTNTLDKILQFCKVTRTDWVESEVTWNVWKTGLSWLSAGGDFVTVSPAAVEYTFPANQVNEFTVDIATLVQDAVDNSIDLHILRKFKDETYSHPDDSFWYSKSKENSDTAGWPTLVITCTATVGRRHRWVEGEEFHWFGESGTERKAIGVPVADDREILHHLNL